MTFYMDYDLFTNYPERDGHIAFYLAKRGSSEPAVEFSLSDIAEAYFQAFCAENTYNLELKAAAEIYAILLETEARRVRLRLQNMRFTEALDE